jgi:beta-lactamase class A
MKNFKSLLLVIISGALLIFSVWYAYDDSVPTLSQTSSGILEKTYSVKENSGKSAEAINLTSNRNKDRAKGLQLFLLQRKIENYLGNNIKKIGLVYYDFKSKSTIVINGDKIFYAASTVKVPLNLIYYNMAAFNTIDLSDKLSYSKSDYEGGTGILQTFSKIKPTEIQTLLDYAIKYSDNIATNMLIRNIGYENMKLDFDKLVGNVIDHESNRTTPNEMIKYLQILYNNPDNNPYYKHLIDIMKETSFHDRLDKYIPQSLAAHKIGDYYKVINGEEYNYVNDIGIIYTNKPYAMAVYTENMNNANDVIAGISKIVYQYQTK